jgi:hypothetical protein
MTILATPAAPHPQFGVRKLTLDFDTGTGVILGDWLDAAGQPVDSGNSVVPLTLSPAALTADQQATLAAAITAATA